MIDATERQSAVSARACPTCGKPRYAPCATASGGQYDPRYFVHSARLIAAGITVRRPR